MRYSKQHEREEARLLRKGAARSWIGLLLSWLPVVGLLFAVGGFLRCKVRLTHRYRRKRAWCMVLASVALVAAIGLNMAELWVYSRDTQVLDRIGQKAWTLVVGKSADITASGAGGTDYPDMETAGLGYADGMLQEESDGLDGDFTGWDDGFDWNAWNDDSNVQIVGGDEWSGEVDAEWYIDDSWDFDADGLFWPEDTLSEPEEGLDWDLDAAFAAQEEQDKEGLHIGKGEVILPLTE